MCKRIGHETLFLLNTSYYDLLVDTKALWYWRPIQRRGSSTEIGGYGWAWSPTISRSPTSCSPANVSFKCPWSCGQQYIPWCPRHRVLFFRLSINSTRGWWASGLGRDTLFTTVETCSANQLQNERIFSENESCKMRGNLFNPKTTLIHDVFLLPNKKYILTQFIVHFLKSSL